MGSATQWRGHADTGRRRLWALLGLSALLHAPLTPLAALLGLLGLLATPERARPPAPPLAAIPVDLEPDTRPAGEGADGESEAARDAEDEDLEDLFDELEDDDDDPEALAAVPKPDPPKREPAPSDVEPDEPLAKPDTSKIADPVGVLGAAASIADANAHVRLLVFTKRIRSHPLGKRIGHLLSMAAQWRSFFGPAYIDPVQDIDQILLAGPELRDSSNVVVVLQHAGDDARIRSAVTELMKHRTPPGEWETVRGMSVATGFADRAERTFILPSKRVVVLVPPRLKDQALKQVRPGTRLPDPGGRVMMTTYVDTPANAMRGIFPVPESIKWVRMDVSTTPDGGAVARIEAEDASPEDAAKNAERMTEQLNAVTQVKLGVVGALLGKKEHRVIEPTKFEAKGSRIVGVVRATPKQLKLLVEQVAALAEEIARERAAKAKAEREKAAAAASASAAVAPEPPVPSAAPPASASAPPD